MQAAAVTLTLVLCHWHEQHADTLGFLVKAAQALPAHARVQKVVLYDHDDDAGSHPWPDGVSVHVIPNFGLEAHCYSHWTTEHAANVSSTHVWFSQAVPDAYMGPKMYPRLQLLTADTTMLCLSIIDRCDCDGCQLAHWYDFRQEYETIVGRNCTGPWTACFNGEFIVSRDRLLAVPPATYEYILALSEAPQNASVHKNVPEFGSTPSKNIAAHIMERLWNPLFNCTDIPACDCEEGVLMTCAPGMCQCTATDV